MSHWTAADQAELDVALYELVRLWFEHRDRCALRPCPHLQAAIGALVDWRDRRELLTRAQDLRARQTAMTELAA